MTRNLLLPTVTVQTVWPYMVLRQNGTRAPGRIRRVSS